MTATNHGLAGAVIAISLQTNPVAAIILAPLSHFLLDTIPHFGGVDTHSKKFFRILFADITLAVVSTLYIAWLWQELALLLVVCAFLAASPDLMWLYYEYLRPTPNGKRGKLAKFHSKIQWSQTHKGIFVEIMVFAVTFYLLTLKI